MAGAAEPTPTIRAVFLVGPTASGKTSVAIDAAERANAEIVSCDSRQIYRGMEIGTAAPTDAERARVRHHLVGCADPTERWNAGRFARAAAEALADVASRGARALLVGGSGLYVQALRDGLADLPRDDAVRAELLGRLEADGPEALHAELTIADAAAAARIHPRNGERLVRALELVRLGGTIDEQWRARNPAAPPFPAPVVGLRHDRSVLHARIDARTPRMFDGGWVEESRRLLERGFNPDWPSYRTLGYPEVVRHIEGDLARGAAIDAIRTATRRFAKRQETWFRGRAGIEWWDPGEAPASKPIAERLAARLEIAPELPVPPVPEEP